MKFKNVMLSAKVHVGVNFIIFILFELYRVVILFKIPGSLLKNQPLKFSKIQIRSLLRLICVWLMRFA